MTNNPDYTIPLDQQAELVNDIIDNLRNADRDNAVDQVIAIGVSIVAELASHQPDSEVFQALGRVLHGADSIIRSGGATMLRVTKGA